MKPNAIYESLNKEFEVANVKKTTKKENQNHHLLLQLYNRKLLQN
ncbi:hypothetical protein SD457_08310 [Coprobacillaceae bacterium CR2/5/TPMF4]|nr:hypothetical protein SD457_08310 [Coprobacillaceae bacterium CR2/5/TPMF4]